MVSLPLVCPPASMRPVYQAPGVPVTILQRRAPHIKVSAGSALSDVCGLHSLTVTPLLSQGHSRAFVAELVAWAKKAGFAQVLVATGADAGHRTDVPLSG